MSQFLADPIAFVEAIGAFWLGFQLFAWLKAHPKLVHLDEEHLFIASSLPVMLLLLVVASHWIFALALVGASWFVYSIIGLQIALFVIGFLKIVHWIFQTFGNKNVSSK